MALVQDLKEFLRLLLDVFEPLALSDRLRNSKPKNVKSLMADKRLTDRNCVHPNAHSSSQQASLFVVEDNGAVIKKIIKGRSPAMRHISRTHRVNSDLLFDRMNLAGSWNSNQICLQFQANC